jgi:AcrR family transcriptional regulator
MPKPKDGTPERLLSAAGELFASHGFQGASVRAICGRAGANPAAVKYHFGSKEGLYRAALLDSHRELRDREPLPRLEDAPSPEAALRAWIVFALRLILLRKHVHPYAGALMARELQAPTAALDELVQLVMRPVLLELERILDALPGRALGPARRRQAAHVVLGLCVHQEHARPVLERFGAPPPRTAAEVEELADTLTAFALSGLAGLRSPGSRPAGAGRSRSPARGT